MDKGVFCYVCAEKANLGRVFKFKDFWTFLMSLCGIGGETWDRTRWVAVDDNLPISSDWRLNYYFALGFRDYFIHKSLLDK